MKNLLFFSILLVGLNSFAQNSLKLAKGQKISVTTTSVGDADLGMGTMKTNTVNTSLIAITGEIDNQYQLTNTLTKMKMDIDGMGKTMTYDSEKPEDKDSEIGKSVSEVIGKPMNLTLNKLSGTTTLEKKDGAEKVPNPMDEMMGSFGSENDPTVSGAFLLIPAGKKVGDTWTVKDSTLQKNSSKTFTINALQDNIATIAFKSVTDANNTMDANGAQMDITSNTQTTGEILLDITTGLVKKSRSTSDVTAKLEVMGQSMPISAKNILESVYTVTE